MATALIRNGTILTESGRVAADVHVEGGIITRVGQGRPPRADTVLDASGLYVVPGGIDAHTHSRRNPQGPGGLRRGAWLFARRGCRHPLLARVSPLGKARESFFDGLLRQATDRPDG